MENLIFDWFKLHWQVTGVTPNPLGLLVNTKPYPETTLVIAIDPQQFEHMTPDIIHGWLQYARENDLYPLILVPRESLPSGGKNYEVPRWLKGLQAVYFGRVYTYLKHNRAVFYIVPVHFKYLSQRSQVYEVVDGPTINHAVGGFKPMVNDTNGEWNSTYPDETLNISIFMDNVFWKGRGANAGGYIPFKHGAKEIDFEIKRERPKPPPPPPNRGNTQRQETPGGFQWGGFFSNDPNLRAAYDYYYAQGKFNNPLAFMFWWDNQGGEAAWERVNATRNERFSNPHKQAAWEFYSQNGRFDDRNLFAIWYDIGGGREEWHRQTKTKGQGQYDYAGQMGRDPFADPFSELEVEAAYQFYHSQEIGWARNRAVFMAWWLDGGAYQWAGVKANHEKYNKPFDEPYKERLYQYMKGDSSPNAYTRVTFHRWWENTEHRPGGLNTYQVTDCRGRAYAYTKAPSYTSGTGYSAGGNAQDMYGNFDASKPFSDPEIEKAYQGYRLNGIPYPYFARDRFQFYRWWNYEGGRQKHRENVKQQQQRYQTTRPQPKPQPSGPYVARGNLSIYDAYELFGMDYNPLASPQQIASDHAQMRAKFKAMSRELHPDTNPNGGEMIKEYTLALSIVQKASKRG